MNTPVTPEQKIITIAKFEGWEHLPTTDETYESWRKPDADKYTPYWCAKPPPYLTSRDAICGAVARLDDEQFCEFIENLEAVTGCYGDQITGVAYKRGMLLATPAQLADALLLTLGHEI